jgi:hypothetical protein
MIKKKQINRTKAVQYHGMNPTHMLIFLIFFNLLVVGGLVMVYWYFQSLWAFALLFLLAYPENEVVVV